VEHAQALTLNAAITLTAMRRRTLWRRVTHGSIAMIDHPPVSSKGRTMLALCDVVSAAALELDEEEIALVIRADEGDAQAQADAGAMFFNKAQYESALFWLEKAVVQVPQ
jgi:uncharacterized protein